MTMYGRELIVCGGAEASSPSRKREGAWKQWRRKKRRIMTIVSGRGWPGVMGPEGEADSDCEEDQVKIHFFDVPGTHDDGSWEVCKPNELETLAAMLQKWKRETIRDDQCWALLGILKHVGDTGAELSADDKAALDEWVPVAQKTLGQTERQQPFKDGVPVMCVGEVLLGKEDDLEVTGQTGAQGECTEDQVSLMLASMLALADGAVKADLGRRRI